MYYGPTVIQQTGIKFSDTDDKDQLAVILNIPLALVNAIGSTVAVFVIDSKGRRYTMLRALPGCAVTLLTTAYSMNLSARPDGTIQHTVGNILAMSSLIGYLAFFSIGMSSTVWSVNTEIYPIHLIGTATALATATNWLSNFAVSSTFLSIMEAGEYGKVLAFVILAMFSVLGWIFIYCMLPETNGRPIPVNVENVMKRRINSPYDINEENNLSTSKEVESELTAG